MSYTQDVQAAFQKAFYAELNGDLVEALRLYRACHPFFKSRGVIEKDGMSVGLQEYEVIIADLKGRIGEQSGAGKLKRVNLTYQRPDCDVNDCYCR